MADTPSSILLLRLQALGSNTNLWGGYLNTAMQMLEQASKGYQAQALTGDTTVSWSNYTTANVGSCAVLKQTGALVATATVTMPGNMNELAVWNNSGMTVTDKVSGGTGIAIPNSRKTRIFCDGVDYYSSAANWLSDYASPLVNNGDIVTKDTLGVAIAASVPLGTAGTFFNSVGDTTRSYLANKVLAAGSFLSIATTTPGGNEASTFTFDEGGMSLYTSVMAL